MRMMGRQESPEALRVDLEKMLVFANHRELGFSAGSIRHRRLRRKQEHGWATVCSPVRARDGEPD
jgi:hypothetical protein